MSKPVKDLVTNEYRKLFGGAEGACVVSVIGLDAISTNKLRGTLRAKKINLKIVKNSLARRAFSDGPLAPLAPALSGPCALVTGGDSVIDVAKTLVELKKTYPKIELRQGLLDGEVELIELERLATMKSKAELAGEVAMLIMSPGRKIAGCLAGPAGRIAGCLKAIADKKEGGAAAGAEAAAPAA
jgi:large subunit ribosomal protein L10